MRGAALLVCVLVLAAAGGCRSQVGANLGASRFMCKRPLDLSFELLGCTDRFVWAVCLNPRRARPSPAKHLRTQSPLLPPPQMAPAPEAEAAGRPSSQATYFDLTFGGYSNFFLADPVVSGEYV